MLSEVFGYGGLDCMKFWVYVFREVFIMVVECGWYSSIYCINWFVEEIVCESCKCMLDLMF